MGISWLPFTFPTRTPSPRAERPTQGYPFSIFMALNIRGIPLHPVLRTLVYMKRSRFEPVHSQAFRSQHHHIWQNVCNKQQYDAEAIQTRPLPITAENYVIPAQVVIPAVFERKERFKAAFRIEAVLPQRRKPYRQDPGLVRAAQVKVDIGRLRRQWFSREERPYVKSH